MSYVLKSLVVVLVLAGQVAHADEPVTLKPIWKPGAKTRVHVEVTTKQLLTLAGMGLPTDNEVFTIMQVSHGERQADGSVEVVHTVDQLQANLKLPMGLEVSFDTGNPDQPAQVPGLQGFIELFKATSEAKTTYTISKDGKLRDVKVENLDISRIPEEYRSTITPKGLRKEHETANAFLPDSPVKVGDTWDAESELDLGGGQTMTFTTAYEYKGTVKREGKTLHQIAGTTKSVAYSATGALPGGLKYENSDLSIADSKEEYLFDAENGYAVVRNSHVQIKGDIAFSINGVDLPGTLDLTFGQKLKTESVLE